MTMHERIMSGKLFSDNCEGMPEERLQAKKLMKEFNELNPDEFEKKAELIGRMFNKCDGAWIEPPIYFCYGKHMNVGKGTYINVNCSFIDDGMINIGEHVMFGPSVTIATVGHPVHPKMRGYMYTDHVTIGNNCWIGAGAVICPGVTIGENTVIGAGSVVTKDIPANVIAVGNPCRVLREIGKQDEIYYYKDRLITEEDLAEERALR